MFDLSADIHDKPFYCSTNPTPEKLMKALRGEGYISATSHLEQFGERTPDMTVRRLYARKDLRGKGVRREP